MALCAVLQATAAVQPAHQVATAAANKPAQGELHAQLVTSTDTTLVVAQHGPDAGPAKASVQPGTQPASGEEHRPTTAATLLAALVLMTGIALRRWGMGEQ
jgi:hypothetical protein